ncbi:MAG TPA: DNA translocase FtsK 4TM domain-containing protein, partial [Candidatus Binataceae bacterium]|nr:DNA translocase FtsK 4TM domain-containing protein [Candidatus Binataceae bacterium]
MRLLGPTRFDRLNEALAVVYLFAGLFLILSLVSYHPDDPSWNAVSSGGHSQNLIGVAGAHAADLCLQALGLTAFAIPFLLWLLAWRWVRSIPIADSGAKIIGSVLLFLSVCTGLTLVLRWRPSSGSFAAGGVLGLLVSDYLRSELNLTGTILVTMIAFIGSLYLISTFSMSGLIAWFAAPHRWWNRWGEALGARWHGWRERKHRVARERARVRAEKRALAKLARMTKAGDEQETLPDAANDERTTAIDEREPSQPEEIPIHELEYEPPPPPPPPPQAPVSATGVDVPEAEPLRPLVYELPPTDLLNEVPERNGYDSAELKEIAARIKSKFAEFNVQGSVVQINPGPVVTTFELKPEAGVKYSRITTLTEDLCLGLQAESILIERIPGRPTVGIEVPNSRREVISLRHILESEEFRNSASKLTICLGRDISGRIRVGALESMPHLLIAGSTGSGK